MHLKLKERQTSCLPGTTIHYYWHCDWTNQINLIMFYKMKGQALFTEKGEIDWVCSIVTYPR